MLQQGHVAPGAALERVQDKVAAMTFTAGLFAQRQRSATGLLDSAIARLNQQRERLPSKADADVERSLAAAISVAHATP